MTFLELYTAFNSELLYSKHSALVHRIGYENFEKAIELGVLVPYGKEYQTNPKNIMKYFFFDTETTGKILDYKDKNISNHSNFPRIVQVAYIVTDDKGTELVKQEHLIKPKGFEIPNEVVKIHGISTELATEKGIDLEIVLNEMLLYMDRCEYTVCHNVNFDIFVLGAEYSRTQIRLPNKNKKICTMETTKEFVGIKTNGVKGWKYPSLQELHKKLFGVEFDKAHTAMADIQATKNCFFELKQNHNFYNE